MLCLCFSCWWKCWPCCWLLLLMRCCGCCWRWLRARAGISTAAVTIYSYLLLYVPIMLLRRMLTGITLLHVNAVDGFGCCWWCLKCFGGAYGLTWPRLIACADLSFYNICRKTLSACSNNWNAFISNGRPASRKYQTAKKQKFTRRLGMPAVNLKRARCRDIFLII